MEPIKLGTNKQLFAFLLKCTVFLIAILLFAGLMAWLSNYSGLLSQAFASISGIVFFVFHKLLSLITWKNIVLVLLIAIAIYLWSIKQILITILNKLYRQ